MRVLGIHTRYFQFECRDKATEGAETLPKDHGLTRIDEECLVVFVSVEKGDAASTQSVAEQLAADTANRAERLGVRRMVLYPYVHLTEEPSTPRVALEVLAKVEGLLSGSIEVVRAPFGWYKAFDLSCIGHPLSEWSARYTLGQSTRAPRPTEAGRRPSEFTRFVVADMDGSTYEITAGDFERCPALAANTLSAARLKQFVANELTQRDPAPGASPKHIEYMRRQELVDYCEVSEKGHYKWYPKGVLIQRLILDYASRLAADWGAFEMKNPIVIRGDHNVVGQLMGEFHERDYQVDGGRGLCYLRYASDPLAFPYLQHVQFSRKQCPLKVYEETSCFRNEQDGEVSGLKRVRNFLMTDMHAACATVAEARREFEVLCMRFADLMNSLVTEGRWVLGWEGTIAFYEENREWLVGLGRKMGVPAFFKLMPEMSHYYAMKNEYQYITEDRTNIQVSTVQWDVKDGERFNIGYRDEDGRKHPCPVILHASSFGSIERTLCAILEDIAHDANEGRPPMLPLWLSPTQVRLIPTSDAFVPFASELCDEMARRDIRVDIDDRDETVGKKIRAGEREWVPYLLVVGEREQTSGRLSVRARRVEQDDPRQRTMTLEEFVTQIPDKMRDMPFRPLPLPRLLSARPSFFG